MADGLHIFTWTRTMKPLSGAGEDWGEKMVRLQCAM
jgi:hypothetical protein